jgi:hypothetical protein
MNNYIPNPDRDTTDSDATPWRVETPTVPIRYTTQFGLHLMAVDPSNHT